MELEALELLLGLFKTSSGALLYSAQLDISTWMHEGLIGPNSREDLKFKCVFMAHCPKSLVFPRLRLLCHNPSWGDNRPTAQPSSLNFPPVMNNIQHTAHFNIPDRQR